jgi:hypothetical protein
MIGFHRFGQKFRSLGKSVKIDFSITCRGSPPYSDLINFRKLVQKVAKSDPKSAHNHSTFQNLNTDDEIRMSDFKMKCEGFVRFGLFTELQIFKIPQ